MTKKIQHSYGLFNYYNDVKEEMESLQKEIDQYNQELEQNLRFSKRIFQQLKQKMN